MRLLLDTHILVWAVAVGGDPGPNPSWRRAASLIDEPENSLHFSVAGIWEVAIKSALGRPGCAHDPQRLRSVLLASGYEEVPISGIHAARVGLLPPIHRDPFDRIQLAQAIAEEMTLVTADKTLARYPGPIIRI